MKRIITFSILAIVWPLYCDGVSAAYEKCKMCSMRFYEQDKSWSKVELASYGPIHQGCCVEYAAILTANVVKKLPPGDQEAIRQARAFVRNAKIQDTVATVFFLGMPIAIALLAIAERLL